MHADITDLKTTNNFFVNIVGNKEMLFFNSDIMLSAKAVSEKWTKVKVSFKRNFAFVAA